MCVPLSKIDREKKMCKNPEYNCMKSFLKEYSYFYAPVFSRDFFIFVVTKRYRKIGQLWQKKIKKKILNKLVLFCQKCIKFEFFPYIISMNPLYFAKKRPSSKENCIVALVVAQIWMQVTPRLLQSVICQGSVN